MKSKRSISILSIVFLLFSIFSTPLTILATNESDSDFQLNIEENDNALVLSWEMEKDEEDVEFVLIKNGEEKTITENVTGEDLSDEGIVLYTYEDAEVSQDTHYTYQVIKTTEDAELLSNEVEFLIPEVEVTTEEEKPAAEESVDEKEDKTDQKPNKKAEEKSSVTEKEQSANERAIEDEDFIEIDIGEVTHLSISVSWETSGIYEVLYLYLDGELIEELSPEDGNFVIENLESGKSYEIEMAGLIGDDIIYSGTIYGVNTDINPADRKEVPIRVLNERNEVLDEYFEYNFKIEGSEESNEQLNVYGEIDEDGNLSTWEDEVISLLPGSYNIVIHKEDNYTLSKEYEINIQKDHDYVEKPIQLVFEEDEVLPQEFNVDLVKVTKGSIQLKWDNLDYVKGYEIEVDYDEVIELDENTNEYTFNNLESNSTYEFDITAKLTSGLNVSKEITVRTNNVGTSEEVKFADEKLEIAIKEELGIHFRDVTTDDMLGLYHLNAYDEGITDLSGLEHATNLHSLHLSYNEITDISPISGLVNVKDLDLSSNEITDITPLNNIEKIIYLTLDNNNISNLEPIRDMVDLYYLRLNNNEIMNIDQVSGLTDLENLYLSNNKVTDISPISNLNNIKILELHDNQITDVKELKGLNELEYLDLDSNEITNLEPLLDLEYLETVYAYDNPIDDYSVIQTLLDNGVDVYFDIYNSLVVHVVQSSNDSITIEWDHKINFGEVDYYNLSIDYSSSIEVDGNTTTYTFTDLEPNELYDIEVEAVYVDDESDYGIIEVWTGETASVQFEAINLSKHEEYGFHMNGIDEANNSFYMAGGIGQDDKLVDFSGNATHQIPKGQYQIEFYNYDTYEEIKTFVVHIDTNKDYIKEPIQLHFHRDSGNQNGEKPDDQNEDETGTPGEKPNDQNENETGTPGKNESVNKDDETNEGTTVKPIIENNKFVFDKSAFDVVENDDVVIIDVTDQKELDIFEIELTEDQVKLLISKNATLQINKSDVRLSIPSSVFTNGSEKVTITIEKLDDVENSLSSVYDFTIKQGDQLISKFENGITLTFEVDKDMVQNTEHVNIYYLNEQNNEWEQIGGTYANGEVSATTNHFSTFAVFEDSSKIIDVPQSEQESAEENQNKLPETATNIYNMFFISFVLVATGLVLLFVQKRRKA